MADSSGHQMKSKSRSQNQPGFFRLPCFSSTRRKLPRGKIVYSNERRVSPQKMNMLQAAAEATSTTESPFADFDDFIRLYQQRIYRLLLAQTGEPDLAEEITQECFIRAFQKQKSF